MEITNSILTKRGKSNNCRYYVLEYITTAIFESSTFSFLLLSEKQLKKYSYIYTKHQLSQNVIHQIVISKAGHLLEF